MSFDPIKEVATEMQKKMEKILSPAPALCITNGQAEIKYIDESLLNRKDYIQNYIRDNFNLIEEGQYSLPIPSDLLGFFRMSNNTMFIIFMESGKIGNLLLYRGLLESYGAIIEDLYSDLEGMKQVEVNANLVIRLRREGAPARVEIEVAPRMASGTEGEKAAAPTAKPSVEAAPAPDIEGAKYPKLLDEYRNKKYNFMEGIVLQHCNGNCYIEEIVVKSRYSMDEVMEVINTYEKKGWVVMLSRRGAEIISEEIMEVPETKKEATEKLIEKMEEVVESVKAETTRGKIYPELLEKFRNKKFSFQEGLILQFCNGKRTVEEIVKETNFSEEDVLETINTYQKKGWLIIHT